MRRAAAAALLLALVPGAAAGGEGEGFLAAAGAAEAVVLGRAGPTQEVDRTGRVAPIAVERVLAGAPPAPLRVAWEDLAPRRAPRLPEQQRVLLALEPLPGFSLWRQRFPGGGPLAIAARGTALRVAPAPATLDAVAGFLALAPAARESAAAAPALIELVAAPDAALAQEALARLDALPGLQDALGGAAGERLGARLGALVGPEVEPAVAVGILQLAGRRRLEALLPAARAASAAPGPLQAPGWQARAAIQGGLPRPTLEALLAEDDPALRAVGAEWLTDPGRTERLRGLLAGDPDGGVRGQALRSLAGEASPEELVAALSDPELRVVHAALPGIAERGASCVGPLLELAERGAGPARPRAVAALTLIEPEGRLALERLARGHPDAQLRDLARLALGRVEFDPHP